MFTKEMIVEYAKKPFVSVLSSAGSIFSVRVVRGASLVKDLGCMGNTTVLRP